MLKKFVHSRLGPLVFSPTCFLQCEHMGKVEGMFLEFLKNLLQSLTRHTLR
jgi:hypothetical protein